MAKTKNKVPVKPIKKVVTTQDKEREAIITEASVIIARIKATQLKQDYIASKMGLLSATLSRFMNLKESYITRSMVDKGKIFIKKYDEGTL